MSGVHRWQGLQRRIGLTGGIASGKSSVSRYLHNQGLPILDADVYAHEALAPGSQATELVLQRYGSSIAQVQKHKNGGFQTVREIDRQALGHIVFNNQSERLWLEHLIHPIVQERLEREIKVHANASSVALVIPLLFEAGLERLCSEIWVVSCSYKQQQERLIKRNGLSKIEAQQRIQIQLPLEQKRQLADQIIDNSGGPNEWKSQVSLILHQESASPNDAAI